MTLPPAPGDSPPSAAPTAPTPPRSATRSPSLEMEESPRYFTPPERASPSPRSAYFDTVRSPKTKSPRASASNKENYFTFEAPSPLRKHVMDCCAKLERLEVDDEAAARRQRLKSISLDSDNARVIEDHLGLPVAKHSCQIVETSDDPIQRPIFEFDRVATDPDTDHAEPSTPDLGNKKGLRQSGDAQSFLDMPRFSPKEFEITVTNEEGTTSDATAKRKDKNLRNLTIDLTKRDSDLEQQLLQFEQLYTTAEEKKVKTPTLKVKATSLDSSESVELSLPQKNTLDVPQNSVSVPNTPKRQIKRLLAQKKMHEQFCGVKLGYNTYTTEQKKIFLKAQDSGIFLRENHANLMLYQPSGSRTVGSFGETETRHRCDANADLRHRDGFGLGADLAAYKPNLSVSSTNLKTLPEGVSSDDFEPIADHDKFVKKLHRRNSNQSLLYSSDAKYTTHSLQGSNWSLSSGASCHNLSARASASNYSLNTDNRPQRLSLERRDSADVQPRNCLLQRRGSNNSLTLNLSRHAAPPAAPAAPPAASAAPRKGLLERRSSNASLTLRIAASSPHLAPPAAAAGARKAASSESLAGAAPGVISTQPLSPRATSAEFRRYLADMQQLQSASCPLSPAALQRLHALFHDGYAAQECPALPDGSCSCAGAEPCARRQRRDVRALHQQFWDMPPNFQDKPLVSGSASKNRYRAVLPNEHSRVRLRNDRYINANYIKGSENGADWYIATQGPLQNTVYDFWSMVQEACDRAGARVCRVVMLTDLVEAGRPKCEPYFPQQPGQRQRHADPDAAAPPFLLTAAALEPRAGYALRRLRLEGGAGAGATVLHYWLRGWEDHRCPADAGALLRLCEELAARGADEAPPVVHCSAGVGRTGCALAVLLAARGVRAGAGADVLAAVSGLRRARGGMVQTSEQYELVHRLLADLHHHHHRQRDRAETPDDITL